MVPGRNYPTHRSHNLLTAEQIRIGPEIGGLVVQLIETRFRNLTTCAESLYEKLGRKSAIALASYLQNLTSWGPYAKRDSLIVPADTSISLSHLGRLLGEFTDPPPSPELIDLVKQYDPDIVAYLPKDEPPTET